MTHEEIVSAYLSNYLNVPKEAVRIVDRLKGGSSNTNYVVKAEGKFYTFRIPGKHADAFVDRTLEAAILELISPLSIDGNLLLRLEAESGIKVSRYVAGIPLSIDDPALHYGAVADLLHTLHQSGLVADNDFAPFIRLKYYENLLEAEGFPLSSGYRDIRDRFLKFKPWLLDRPTVLCHNDGEPSNFILTPDGRLLLVDWEYGGNNDPLYDVACYGNVDFRHAVGLLPIYLRREPRRDEWLRLYLWRVFQCLQGHNVALYKEATGQSAEQGVDFRMIAENGIDKANKLFDEAKKWQ